MTSTPDLTRRERECMELACDGKTAWEIGVIIGITVLTCRHYLQSAKVKLGATNIAQACVLFDRARRGA